MLRALKNLTEEDKAAIKYLSFLTLKPTMYIANVNEDGFENNPTSIKCAKSPMPKVLLSLPCVRRLSPISLNSTMQTAKNLWPNWALKSRV
jgi:hypothetical protein